ncbi:MAG: hypothetical protein AAF567_20170 [Actinomycetota bacterium]
MPSTLISTPKFDALLTAWNQHYALSRSGASIPELAASRARLDEARLAVRAVPATH